MKRLSVVHKMPAALADADANATVAYNQNSRPI